MAEQLIKKTEEGYSNVMPKSWIEAITDKSTGESLTHILQGFNMYFLSYTGNTEQTRCQVSKILRRKGLWITYVKYDGNVYTEWYNSNDIDDKSWGNSSNWRVGNNELVGDLTISANGNWVINGNETEFRAIGEKGNTPLIRIANNKLQVSYDTGNTYHNVDDNPVYTQIRTYNNKLQISTDLGANWVDASDEIAAYFRFNSGQGNNVGNIQISRNNKDWNDLSGNFVNNLHISKYIGANETLPTSGVAEGTIYAKGPTYTDSDTSHSNPIYRLWVYAYKDNTLAWQDNGEFTSIAAGIVQETGSNENTVMSQKATSAALSAIQQQLTELEVIGEQVNALKVTWEKTTEDADIEWLDNTRLSWNNVTEPVAGYKTSAKIILLDSKTKYVLFPYISKKLYSYVSAIFFDTKFNLVESLQVPKNYNSDYHNVVVEIPNNVKAMRVSKTDGEDFSFTEYQTIDELANALADLTSLEEVQAETKVGGVLYANKQYAQSEGIIDSTNARYKRIRVLEGETYTIIGSSGANLAVWRWNDKYSKTILSNVDITPSEVYGTKNLFMEITAPKNAVWLYVGWVVSGNRAIDEGHIYRKKTGAMDALRNIRTSEYPQFDFSSYYQDGKSDNFYDYVTPLENDAYIVVGQSNVDGRINNAQFPATITFGGETIETSKSLPNLQFMKSATGSVYDELTKTFQPRNNTGAWAFDEIIYNLLDKLVYNPSSNGRNFYVLKATRGATTIEPRYDIAFSADIKALKDKGYESMMIHLKNLIKSAKLQNPNLRFKGIIIYECEGDMTVTKYPYQYYNNLGGMIAYIRGLVGQPNIPVFIGAPATNLPDYNQLVVDDMRELAKNINDIHLIEIGESEGWVDDGMNVHFNAAAAERIGCLYYQAMVDAKII